MHQKENQGEEWGEEAGTRPQTALGLAQHHADKAEARPASTCRGAQALHTHRAEDSGTFWKGVGVILARRGSLAYRDRRGGEEGCPSLHRAWPLPPAQPLT